MMTYDFVNKCSLGRKGSSYIVVASVMLACMARINKVIDDISIDLNPEWHSDNKCSRKDMILAAINNAFISSDCEDMKYCVYRNANTIVALAWYGACFRLQEDDYIKEIIYDLTEHVNDILLETIESLNESGVKRLGDIAYNMRRSANRW